MTKLEEALGRLGNLELDKNKKHNISVIIDRLVVKEGIRSRLYSSLETATKLSHGKVIIDVIGGEELLMMVLRHITLIKNL